jgi:hypothetical protein
MRCLPLPSRHDECIVSRNQLMNGLDLLLFVLYKAASIWRIGRNISTVMMAYAHTCWRKRLQDGIHPMCVTRSATSKLRMWGARGGSHWKAAVIPHSSGRNPRAGLWSASYGNMTSRNRGHDMGTRAEELDKEDGLPETVMFDMNFATPPGGNGSPLCVTEALPLCFKLIQACRRW